MQEQHRRWPTVVAVATASWLLMVAASAQTAWPAFTHNLQPGTSESPVPAVLPSGGTMAPPDPALPEARRRWYGTWHGWACGSARCDVRVAIESVSAERATIAYAGGNAKGLTADRTEGTFENDELSARLGTTGARLVLRLRASGDMEMSLWKPDAKLLAVGVLTQTPPATVYTRSIERVPTPWSDGGKAETLEMVVYRPLGTGPFPTLIFNHGSTGVGKRPEWFKLTWTSPEVARYFTSKGWQVLFPQRRGRGQSDGVYDEGFQVNRFAGYSCEPERALAGFDRAAQDLDAVMAYVRALPDVDSKRLLIGGVSRGGILAVSYAGAHPEMFVGVLDFVGGWIGEICSQASLVNQTLAKRGAEFKPPTLWLYSERDPYYTLRHSRANFDSFIAAGGQGKFLAYEPLPGRNGHELNSDPSVWMPAMDQYLAGIADKH